MKAISGIFCLFMLAAAGCYTISETEYPQVSVTPAPSGNPIRVKLANFRTGLHKYVPVEGHETMAKVYDSAFEKVLFEKSYEQFYSAVIWGPIPFLSPAFSDKTKDQTASSWAITALADTAIADATAFISGQQKK